MGLLDGKRALVTGVANRWSIAYAIAKAFHEQGARLAFTYQGERVRDEVEKLAAECDGAAVIECDVSNDEHLAHLRDKLRTHWGGLDTLVHSIAYANKEDLAGKVYQTSRAGFALTLDISAFSLVGLVGSLVDVLSDGASIMALTYLGATEIVPNYNLMGIAKAALESEVRYLAYDLGERGIRVNAISAGPIKTASSRQVGGFSHILGVVPKVAPLKRNITVDDVANTAVYLASELSSAITADVHFVDSGFHAVGIPPLES
ncbi:enoyl-ACP reductase [bacterium]|nr:MAG: enoyl-ACP reductase [bacterium]